MLEVKLKTQIRMPFSNEYVDKDTILVVEDIRGAYYVCRTKDGSCISVPKEICEEIRNEVK